MIRISNLLLLSCLMAVANGDWVRFRVDPLTGTIENEESLIQ